MHHALLGWLRCQRQSAQSCLFLWTAQLLHPPPKFNPLAWCGHLAWLLRVQMHPLLHFNAHLVPSPVQGKLAFVVLRLCAHAKNGKSHLTPKVAGKFLDLFATTAQQFRGYVFSSQDATKGQVWPAMCCSISLVVKPPRLVLVPGSQA